MPALACMGPPFLIGHNLLTVLRAGLPTMIPHQEQTLQVGASLATFKIYVRELLRGLTEFSMFTANQQEARCW